MLCFGLLIFSLPPVFCCQYYVVTDTGLIEARYDAVEELLEDIEMFTSLQSALVKFPDIEKVITLSIQIPK